MIDPLQTNISQYANSPVILALLNDWSIDLDKRAMFQDFIDKIWDIYTAATYDGTGPGQNTYGLDLWGRRVGVSRTISVPSTLPFFGFAEAGYAVGGGSQPFGNSGSDWPPGVGGQSPMYNGAASNIQTNLYGADYLVLIMAKALSNISDCSVPVINQIMYSLFLAPGRPYAGYRAYCFDRGNMEMAYYFGFALDATSLAILQYSGVMQRPAGVLAYVEDVDVAHCFGFAGTELQPMGNNSSDWPPGVGGQGPFFGTERLIVH
jgi:hypothetical protein